MAAEQKSSSLVQGTLHMLILKTLALEPMHGYGIGVRLEQISKGVFQVNLERREPFEDPLDQRHRFAQPRGHARLTHQER
jgi:hypothetical protein